jgi:phosphohistidine phosphatase
MKLYLLRHGEAEATAPSDKLRPLSAHGKEEVRAILSENLTVFESVDHVFVSPYFRAQQTAAIVQASINKPQTDSDLLIPGASVPALIEFLHQQSEGVSAVVLVAHNPLLEALISALGAFENGAHRMGTASLASLECKVLEEGSCTLNWIRHSNGV